MMKRSSCTPSARLVQATSANVDVAKAVLLQDEIARRGGLGLKRIGTELIGPCVRCGGDNRFGISVAKQVWNCRGCRRGGDVIELVRHLDGCSFGAAVRTLAGSDRQIEVMHRIRQHGAGDRKPPQNDDRARTELALRIWRESTAITGTLAERYLAGRKLHDLPGDGVLRFSRSCPFGGERHPCLVALFRDVLTDLPKAIHRTALTQEGVKIGRLTLGPTRGTVIKLDADEDVTQGLALGEGIETVLAARQLGFKPAWATGSAGGIAKFPVLSGVEALTVLVDSDPPDKRGRQAGQSAAEELWNKWAAAGHEVRAFTASELGCDIADIIETTGEQNAG